MNSPHLGRIGLAIWFITLAILAFAAVDSATAANPPGKPLPVAPLPPAHPLLEKAFISFRIGTPQLVRDQLYRDLLALVYNDKGGT